MFPCSKCGLCCKNIKATTETLKDTELKFPYKVNEDGSCEKLVDGMCSVYEERPLVCRVEELGKFLKIEPGEWLDLNIKACNELMDRNNIDEKLRIK